jgi:hypothetical protein
VCPIRRLLVVVPLVVGLVVVAWPVAAAPAEAPSGRAGQLERLARELAVRLRAVPVRDGDFADPGRYCPADRLAVSFTPPAGAFRFGAYIPPLGPAPGPATTGVNGVVTCRGATYAYMGFEARWTTGGWRVVDVPALDEPAPYQPQTTCSPRPKPGVVGFQRIVLASFPGTGSSGISRDCSIGGRRFAMARRLGVMYIIHNRRIWGSYRATEGWRPYVGANPHTDHVHFSFSWAGARKQTSYWDGTPVTYGSPA